MSTDEPEKSASEGEVKPPRRSAAPRPKSSANSIAPPQVINKKTEMQEGIPESIADRKARLEEQKADADHRRYVEKVILWLVVIMLGGVFVISVVVVVANMNSPDSIKWATMSLTSLISTGIGFAGGKILKSDHLKMFEFTILLN